MNTLTSEPLLYLAWYSKVIRLINNNQHLHSILPLNILAIYLLSSQIIKYLIEEKQLNYNK